MATETKKTTSKKVASTKTKKSEIEEFETIEALMVYVQSNVKVDKDQHNEFGDFNFYKIDRILHQLKKLLLEHGAFARFSTDIVPKGERYYVQAKFKISYKGMVFEEVAEVREPVSKPKMDDSQVTRSATTQAKKTLLENILLITDHVEPDAYNNNEYQYQTDSELAEEHRKLIEYTLRMIKQTQNQGEYSATDEQVEKWREQLHNDPKRTYSEVMSFGKAASEKYQESLREGE